MIFNASLSVAPLEVLVQLVQIGGIGGTLAFLLLGYKLLADERAMTDAQGNRVARPDVFEAIYKFLRYALVFFVVGIAAQVGITLMQDRLHRWGQSDSVQLIFDRWFYDDDNKRATVSFSQATLSDRSGVERAKRSDYAVYVGMRARRASKPQAGEYPVLLGPFNFGPAQEQEKQLTEEQKTLLGKCVQFVLFGVANSEQELAEPFKPAMLATRPVVFSSVSSCRTP